MSREEQEGWLEVHEANKDRIEPNEFGVAAYEMVFYGDDLVENLNGLSYGEKIPKGTAINNYFKDTFTYENEDSSINSVALGITGDSVRRQSLLLQVVRNPFVNLTRRVLLAFYFG